MNAAPPRAVGLDGAALAPIAARALTAWVDAVGDLEGVLRVNFAISPGIPIRICGRRGIGGVETPEGADGEARRGVVDIPQRRPPLVVLVFRRRHARIRLFA